MSAGRNLNEMADWLTGMVAKTLGLAPKDMDRDAPFARYGLDSIDASVLAAEIGEQTGLAVEPTLLWDHNTINKCAAHLMTAATGQAA